MALYCLSSKYGIHTAVYNKSYVWTTLSNHLLLSDTEIFERSGVHLIFLGHTHYRILREIKQPSPGRTLPPITVTPDRKSSSTQKGRCKTTCRKGTRNSATKTQCTPATRKKARTLSENRSQQYGITDTTDSTTTSRSRRRSRCDIDYLSLNDGLEEDIVESPK